MESEMQWRKWGKMEGDEEDWREAEELTRREGLIGGVGTGKKDGVQRRRWREMVGVAGGSVTRVPGTKIG